MKNELIYYYGINVDELRKINNNYFFLYNGKNYTLELYIRQINELTDIYNLNKEMLYNGINTFKIIINKYNSLIINYDEKNYILMEMPNIENKIINFDDIIKYRFVPKNSYYSLDKSNWALLWENKIDYIENQFKEMFGKYELLNESINYYIGIWENAISYLNIEKTEIKKEVCHKRLSTNIDLFDYINPQNLVIDTKIRDISEYIKDYVICKNYSIDNIVKYLDKINLNRNDCILLIARTLFPSLYFDMYSDVIHLKKSEKEITYIVDHRYNYQKLIKQLFLYYQKYNIYFIDWIKKD